MKRFIDKVLSHPKIENLTWHSYESSGEDYAKNVDDLYPYKEAERFLSMIPVGGSIIDIGCGSGKDARNFSEKGFNVTGIDFSPKMIEIARKNAPKAIFNVIDMHSLEVNYKFDAAWANASLLHIPKHDFKKVLTKIYDILNCNGFLYIKLKQGNHEGLELDARYDNLQKFYSYFQEDELKDFLFNARFILLDLFTTKKETSYQTHPYIHAFCKKLEKTRNLVSP